MHTHMHTCMHAYVYTYIHTSVYAYLRTYIIHTLYIHACMYTHIHTYMYTNVQTYIAAYIYIQTCLHTTQTLKLVWADCGNVALQEDWPWLRDDSVWSRIVTPRPQPWCWSSITHLNVCSCSNKYYCIKKLNYNSSMLMTLIQYQPL